MTNYSVRYGHSSNGTPGHITVDAPTPRAAIRAVRRLVADGCRGETWAAVDLPGMTYIARNLRGRAVGRLTRH